GVGDGRVGEERRPAPPHGREQRLLAPDVEVGVLLPGERGGGEVLGRGAGANRVGVLRAELPPGREDGGPDAGGYGQRLQGLTDAGSEGTDRPQVLVRHPVERVQHRVEVAARPNEVEVRRGGGAEARGEPEGGARRRARLCALPADLV